MEEFWSGFKLFKASLINRGTPDFWKLLGWWWQETHVDIPLYQESKIIEEKMRGMFLSDGRFGVTPLNDINGMSYNSPLTMSYNIAKSIPYNTNSAFLVCDGKGVYHINMGEKREGYYYWKGANLAIWINKTPNFFSKSMVKNIFDLEWHSAVKDKPKPVSLYISRLRERLK
jgi:hypothetical protein